jgi:uncharacterized protein
MPMTRADLKTRTVRDLANLAKKQKVPGWHGMRKDELVKALLKHARSHISNRGNQQRNGNGNAKLSGHQENIEGRLNKIKEKLSQIKDLSIQTDGDGSGQSKDRLVVMVRDPFWLHAYWELDRRSINRARVAMSQHWHASRPILRLFEVLREGAIVSARKVERDIDIHGGVNNWYIDVRDPPKTFQLEIGYLSAAGRFFCLARSNVVTTPAAGKENSFDKNWSEVAKDFERIFALSGGYSEPENRGDLKEVFEERLKRPMGETIAAQFGMGEGADGEGKIKLKVDAELIVHGVTEPGAHVTLHGEPVRLRSDGTFAVRFNLPERRHILPVVASSASGGEQRTIVLSIDRNTKIMEPLIRETSD